MWTGSRKASIYETNVCHMFSGSDVSAVQLRQSKSDILFCGIGIYIYFIKYTEVLLSNAAFCRFYSVLLPVAAKSNSTRLRFWQPEHEGNFLFYIQGQIQYER